MARAHFVVAHASVAEWSIATDCKSVGFKPTLVRIQPGAPRKIKPHICGVLNKTIKLLDF